MMQFAPIDLLYVMAGGALGAGLRYTAVFFYTQQWGAAFPGGTLIVNVVGSVLMGFLAEISGRYGLSEASRLFFATGVLGGFTTFSAFSLDSIGLFQRGEVMMGAIYIVSSVLLSLAGLIIGMKLGGA